MTLSRTEMQYMREDGQPKVPPFDRERLDARIVLDVRLCEDGGPRTGQACRCPGTPNEWRESCGRVAFRNVGDNPWIVCVCGHEFNANYSQVGQTPWPEPPSGQFFVSVLGDAPDYAAVDRERNKTKSDELDRTLYLLGNLLEGAEAAAETAEEHAEVSAMIQTINALERQKKGLE